MSSLNLFVLFIPSYNSKKTFLDDLLPFTQVPFIKKYLRNSKLDTSFIDDGIRKVLPQNIWIISNGVISSSPPSHPGNPFRTLLTFLYFCVILFSKAGHCINFRCSSNQNSFSEQRQTRPNFKSTSVTSTTRFRRNSFHLLR